MCVCYVHILKKSVGYRAEERISAHVKFDEHQIINQEEQSPMLRYAKQSKDLGDYRGMYSPITNKIGQEERAPIHVHYIGMIFDKYLSFIAPGGGIDIDHHHRRREAAWNDITQHVNLVSEGQESTLSI